MKKGLLVYQTNPSNNIFNIGDYIQSLAASQFFDNDIDVYINREHLDSYNGDDVKMIMNGWFMHQPKNWPPSDKIHPLFVAFHLNKLAQEELLSEESLRYFKAHEPIGCRDYHTVDLLTKNGVSAYFSGCMTLTLGQTYKYQGKRDGKIYFTDAPACWDKSILAIAKNIAFALLHIPSLLTICRKKYGALNFSFLFKTASFIRQYSKLFEIAVLRNAIYKKQEILDNFNSDDEKFEYAKRLLNEYSKAQFVVTSRIHCALPCLALETPVLYVYNTEQDELSSCRMKGLLDLFHVIKINSKQFTCSLKHGKIGMNYSFSNKDTYRKFSEELSERCRKFANE